MHLTVLLRQGHRDADLARRGVAHKLSLWPLSRSYMGEPRQGLILGFGGTTAKEIPDAVRRLRNLLATKSLPLDLRHGGNPLSFADHKRFNANRAASFRNLPTDMFPLRENASCVSSGHCLD